MMAMNFGFVARETLSQSSYFVSGITAINGFPRFVTTTGSRRPSRA